MSFIAAVVAQSLQNDLTELEKMKKEDSEKRIRNKLPNRIAALIDLKNQKCKIYNDVILPKELQSKGNTIYKLFGLKFLYAIPKHRCNHKKSQEIELILNYAVTRSCTRDCATKTREKLCRSEEYI